MRFGGKKSNEISSYYNIGGKFLEFVAVHKDLGVKVDYRLRFHEHVREVVRKAGGLAGELLRSTVCRSSEFMVTLYISHIRPIMDFSSSVWSVGYLGDIRLLELIQRRWTREITSIGHLSYVERLKVLGLYSVYGN